MKKKTGLLLAAIMAVGVLAGCAGGTGESGAEQPKAEVSGATGGEAAGTKTDGDIVIGLTLMDYNFPFFQDMLAMAKYTAEQEGVKLIDIDAAGDVQKQLQGVEDLIAASNVNALFLNPVDSEAISPATLQANEDGIPVVTVDVRSAQGDAVAHVASNNIQIGQEAAKYAVEVLKERNNGEVKGNVFVMGFPQITSIRDRADGFINYMADYPDVTIEYESPIGLNVQDALNLWEDKMQKYAEGTLDLVYGANSSNSTGILSATESAGRTDFGIIGVDDEPILLEALEKEGCPFLATVVQSPTQMGKIGIELCVKAAKGEPIDSAEVETPLEVVTRDTIQEFNAKMADVHKLLESYQ